MAPEMIQGVAVALGIGLLIGIERERSIAEKASPALAGVRSFTLLCVLGATSTLFEPWVMGLMLAAVGALVTASYLRTAPSDPGITTELATLLVFLLGALAMREPLLAASMGVVAAVLLAAKAPMHRFSRELISASEQRDGLLLAAAALVVLPLLPDRPVGPFGVLNPWRVWLLVVLSMAIAALGHIALRVVGGRFGLALAGFFAGFVSSTAATAGFGQRVRDEPGRLHAAVAAAMFASLASLSLFVPLLSAVAPHFLRSIVVPLAAAMLVTLIGGVLGLRRDVDGVEQPTASSRMFRFRQALGFALAVSAMLMLSAALNQWLGPRAVLVGTTLAALVEAHASALSLGQLDAGGQLSRETAILGFLGVLAASSLSKSVIAWLSGGRAYGLRVGIGLLAMTVAATVAAWLIRIEGASH
ncbi:MAG: MgtC/SapB family protein [Pseudomarimonas sp.]